MRSIIGMEVPSNSSVFTGLVGVAPEATLGMYRVFGCTGGAGDDGILAAMQRAVDDGADVVSMSLGEPGLWSGYPYSAIPAAAAALRQKGVAVIAAAGNYGSSAPFYTEIPGNAEGVLSIASVENSQFPTYPVRDSNGHEFRYAALYPFPEGDYPVVWASRGNNSGYDDYGCTTASYPSADSLEHPIEDCIVVSRRGLCTLTQIQSAAAAANFSQVLTFPDPGVDNVFIDGYGVATPALTADGGIYNFGNTLDDALLKAEGSSDYVLSVTSGQVSLVDQIGGGFPNNFSSVGKSESPRVLLLVCICIVSSLANMSQCRPHE
ncbi:hypothetical protein SLS62_000624 [Diatrype stigma]|uniref:Peptidase S8/S53 domain-containing protein n=1 Tax=Diatrype stigma TaxID=117547 RepID=A0AAN9YX12_9PEZI